MYKRLIILLILLPLLCFSQIRELQVLGVYDTVGNGNNGKISLHIFTIETTDTSENIIFGTLYYNAKLYEGARLVEEIDSIPECIDPRNLNMTENFEWNCIFQNVPDNKQYILYITDGTLPEPLDMRVVFN